MKTSVLVYKLNEFINQYISDITTNTEFNEMKKLLTSKKNLKLLTKASKILGKKTKKAIENIKIAA